MADKTSTGAWATRQDSGNVTTSGTTASTSVKITWDDADPKHQILDAFEIARVQMMDYLHRRLS